MLFGPHLRSTHTLRKFTVLYGATRKVPPDECLGDLLTFLLTQSWRAAVAHLSFMLYVTVMSVFCIHCRLCSGVPEFSETWRDWLNCCNAVRTVRPNCSNC